MAAELVTRAPDDLIERVVVGGDLTALTPAQRTQYYQGVCESLGLNPLTRPFEYIRLQGKLTLYARRDAADQLRRLHGISVEIVSRTKVDDLYVVTARASNRDGRVDESIGAVSVAGLNGEALANALMKAETKAKRRVTLSICGLGWSDETEVETIPNARPVVVDADGVIAEPQLPEPSDEPHWIDDERARRRFWAWTSETLGLSSRDVYTALGVEHVHDYAGSMTDAKAAIESYVANYAGAATEEGEA
jgi:hypothetical protein